MIQGKTKNATQECYHNDECLIKKMFNCPYT